MNFATGRLALPGVNGEMVPGPTRFGPTRWVPHVPPSMFGTDAAREGAQAPAPAAPAAPRDSTTRTPSQGGHE